MPSPPLAANILNALEEQTKTGHLCDVLFYNNSGSVWAHSCVLAGFSPVFDHMFSLNLKNSHHWSLKQPIQITVNNNSICQSEAISNCIQCLAQVVKFIYTGHIKPNALHLHHLFLLSDRLGNKDLFKICDEYRKDNLNSKEQESALSVTVQKIVSEDKSIPSNSLQKHIVESSEKTENAAIQRDEDLQSIFDCSVCHFVSNDRNRFEIHGTIFHYNSYKCFYCGNCYKSISTLLHHMGKECKSDSQVICSVCLSESPSSLELLSHLKEHQSEKPFLCHTCKRAYDRRSVWLKHLRTHRLNSTNPCPTCGVEFKTSAEYAKHYKAVHAPKKHVCDMCGFTSAFPHLLEKHRLKHRRVLGCDQLNCDFRTSSESLLIRHRSIHKYKKLTKVDKNHECSTCNIKFTLHKNLVRHMKIHECEESKMKCPLCGYETSRTDKFNDHMEFKHDRSQVQNDKAANRDKNLNAQSINETSKPDNKNSAIDEDKTYSDRIGKPQSTSKETYSVESFSNKHNTLLMNDEGDISIVNTNEKNSVTLRNIGNLTGSITLDEKTGVLTMSNINSGSVFLNETTGELTYINLESDNYHFNADSAVQGDNFTTPAVQLSTEITKLDEVTGEIIKVLPTNEEAVAPDQDFDYFDMDVNDDSLDGFDDFDEVLFDVFTDNEPEFDRRVSLRDDLSLMNASIMPHLDESTGLLTFDENLHNTGVHQNENWNSSFSQGTEDDSNGEEAYKLLLDEVTGVLHD